MKGYRGFILGNRQGYIPIMEYLMDRQMENDMVTGLLQCLKHPGVTVSVAWL